MNGTFEISMAHPRLNISEKALADFCQKNRIRKLSLFGSALTEQFSARSDLDLLVEFEPGAKTGFFGLIEMELALSEMAGRKVDLRTPEELSPSFRETVLNTAVTQYAHG